MLTRRVLLGTSVAAAVAASLPGRAAQMMVSGPRLYLDGAGDGDLIPAARLIDWTQAGVDGGIPDRTTIDATISSAGGNDSTSNTTTLQNAIDAAASGEVVKIPPGIYRTGSLTMKSGVTLRGSGRPRKSTSSVAIGTGTKTFTVPSGLGYVSGIQVRVWRPTDSGYYMQGSVTSYTGTSLVLSISDTGGSGTYADWRVSVTVLKSSSTNPLLRFGTNNLAYSTSGTFRTISSGATRGSTTITVNSGSPSISTGQLLVITETNNSEVEYGGTANGLDSAAWVDGWDTGGERAKGQIVEVTGVSGNNITFFPALFCDYTNTPWATPFTAECDGAVCEDFMVFAADASAPTENILMRKAMNCAVRRVDFDFAGGDHGAMDWCYRCEIRDSDFWDGFDHGGGSYVGGLLLRKKSTFCRIENNVLSRINDSVMVEWGAAGNVIAFNYTRAGFNVQSSSNSWLSKCITANHGAHPQFNLFEGNIGDKFQADSYWGTSSEGLVYRNYFSGFRTRNEPINARGTQSNSKNLTQENVACDIWEGQLRYSIVGNVLGNNGNWSGRSPVRKKSTSGWGYDTPYALTLNKSSSAGAEGSALTSPVATHIDHGNWDSITDAISWDGTIANHTLPASFAYAAKPSWWDDAASWPPVDPENVPGTLTDITNPAKLRYENGDSSNGAVDVDLFGNFETSSDGTNITATIARNSFQGQQASSWNTSNDPNSLASGATTNMSIATAASMAQDIDLTADGSAISVPVSTKGMRVSHASDGCLLLNYQPSASPSMGFHLRWNGAQQNSSPRDVAGWWNTSGHFQVLQFYDGASPYFHAHFQPNGGSNVGNNVTIQKGHRYWFTMQWVDGGNTFSISCYDAENGYALVGTSTGSITGSSTNKPSWTEIGLIKYFAGSGQSFDFDNIMINWDGTPVPIPG